VRGLYLFSIQRLLGILFSFCFTRLILSHQIVSASDPLRRDPSHPSTSRVTSQGIFFFFFFFIFSSFFTCYLHRQVIKKRTKNKKCWSGFVLPVVGPLIDCEINSDRLTRQKMNFFVLFVCCLLNNWHIGFQIITCRRVGSVNHNSRDGKGGWGRRLKWWMVLRSFMVVRPSVKILSDFESTVSLHVCHGYLKTRIHLPPILFRVVCVCV
jgi:hypothetical protein